MSYIKVFEKEIIEKIQKEKEAGTPMYETAKKLGVNTDIVRSCWNGNPRDRRKRNFTLEEKYTAQELYKQGFSVSQIAIELGVSWNIAKRLLDSMCLFD